MFQFMYVTWRSKVTINRRLIMHGCLHDLTVFSFAYACRIVKYTKLNPLRNIIHVHATEDLDILVCHGTIFWAYDMCNVCLSQWRRLSAMCHLVV